jgi:hypothetical protein
MFRKGDYVHAWMHGFGQVAISGEVPLIRFLDGRETHVPETQLTAVSADEFDRQLANLAWINARLIIYVHGPEWLGPGGRIWTRDGDGLWTTFDRLNRKTTHRPENTADTWLDEIPGEFQVINADDPQDDDDLIECVVTRVTARENGEGQ